jgi:hypothetical protein
VTGQPIRSGAEDRAQGVQDWTDGKRESLQTQPETLGPIGAIGERRTTDNRGHRRSTIAAADQDPWQSTPGHKVGSRRSLDMSVHA